MGLTEEELQPLVQAWRAANPNIVKFWWDVDRAVLTAVRDKTTAETHGIRFLRRSFTSTPHRLSLRSAFRFGGGYRGLPRFPGLTLTT